MSQGNGSFPSFSLTMLCCLQSHRASSILLSTLKTPARAWVRRGALRRGPSRAGRGG